MRAGLQDLFHGRQEHTRNMNLPEHAGPVLGGPLRPGSLPSRGSRQRPLIKTLMCPVCTPHSLACQPGEGWGAMENATCVPTVGGLAGLLGAAAGGAGRAGCERDFPQDGAGGSACRFKSAKWCRKSAVPGPAWTLTRGGDPVGSLLVWGTCPPLPALTFSPPSQGMGIQTTLLVDRPGRKGAGSLRCRQCVTQWLQ